MCEGDRVLVIDGGEAGVVVPWQPEWGEQGEYIAVRLAATPDEVTAFLPWELAPQPRWWDRPVLG
jgi:hypothetical protein